MFEILKKPEVVASIITALVTIVVVIITSIVTIKQSKANSKIIIDQSKSQRSIDTVTKNRIEWIQTLKEYMSEYIGLAKYNPFKNPPRDLGDFLEKLNKITSKIELHLNFDGDADKEIIKEIKRMNDALEIFFIGFKTTSKDEVISNDLKIFLIDEYGENLYFKIKDAVKEYGISNKEEFILYCYDILNEEINPDKFILDQMNKFIKSTVLFSGKIIKYLPELIELLTQIYLKTEWERIKVESSEGDVNKFDFNTLYYEYKKQVDGRIKYIYSQIKNEV